MATNAPTEKYRSSITLIRHWGGAEHAAVTEEQLKLCEDCGLDSLLHLASMTSIKVQTLAIKVINSLVAGENGEVSIGTEDGFTPLVELTKFAEDNVQREAVWALAIMASNTLCQVRIEQEVGWYNFRKYAASRVPEIQAGTAILLGNLALAQRNQESIMMKGVPLLFTMLSDTKDPKVRRAVVTALSNVSIIEGFGAKDVWLDRGIQMVMPYLDLIGDDLQLQVGALNTIANVCNHDKSTELKRKVAQQGGIGKLVPLLSSKDEMIVKLAAMTIANMASEDSHRAAMHDLQIEGALIRLLDSRDEEVQLGVTMAINALADHTATCKEFNARQTSSPLKDLILITKDRDIAKESKEALAKIAPDVYTSLNLKESFTGSGNTSSGDSQTYSSTSYVSDDEVDRDRDEEDYDSRTSESYDDRSDDSDHEKKTRKLVASQKDAKRIGEIRKFTEEQIRKRQGSQLIARQQFEEATKKAIEEAQIRDRNDKRLEEMRAKREEELAHEKKHKGLKDEVEKQINSEEDDMVSDSLRTESVGSEPDEKIELERWKQDAIDRARAAEEQTRAVEKQTRQEEEKKAQEEKKKKDAEDEETRRKEMEEKQRREEEVKQRKEEEVKQRREEEVKQRKEDEVKQRRDEEKQRREEELKIREDEKKRKRREEEARRRKIEEDEFKRREEVERKRIEEEDDDDDDEEMKEYMDDSRYDKSGGRSGDGGSHASRSTSVDSIVNSNNPGKNLVYLLRIAKIKKGITRDALRELDNFAATKEKDQLQYGENVIRILVYIIYFYPDKDHPDIVAISLYLLALFARYHVKHQLAIRRASGGEQIVQLLQSGTESVRRNAALALGAFVLNNKSVQAEVPRAIPMLVRLLENRQSSATTVRTVAACLASIADSNSAHQAQVVEAGGLAAAVALLPKNRHFIRSSLNLVSAIASHNTEAQNAVLSEYPSFFGDLLTMLSSPESPEYREAITNTLVELVKNNTIVQKALYSVDGVSKLAPLLASFRSEADYATVRVMVNTTYLLYTLLKLSKYSSKVHAKLVRLRVGDLVRPMCSAKSRLLAESAMNLMKAIESKGHSVDTLQSEW